MWIVGLICFLGVFLWWCDAITQEKQGKKKEVNPTTFPIREANESAVETVPLLTDIDRGYEIHYRDSMGNSTTRQITLHTITGSQEGEPQYIITYCHLRHEPRTFRIDRIIQLIDMQTGEVVDRPGRFFRQLIVQMR